MINAGGPGLKELKCGLSMKCCATCVPISTGDLPLGHDLKYASALLWALTLRQPVNASRKIEQRAVTNLVIMFIRWSVRYLLNRYPYLCPDEVWVMNIQPSHHVIGIDHGDGTNRTAQPPPLASFKSNTLARVTDFVLMATCFGCSPASGASA